MKPRLVSSAHNLRAIEAAINAFWFSESYRVNAATLAIENDARTVPEGYRVRLKNGRYRFEAISF